MIIRFLNFINEDISPGEQIYNQFIPDQKMVFYLSENLIMKLQKIKDEYKIAKLLFDLKEGVDKINLVPDPVNYLDVDEDGNISFLKSKYFEESNPSGMYFNNGRRQKSKASRILRDIYNEQFINNNIKQTDIEAFINKWGLMNKKRAAEVVELRGDEVVRAYGLTGELDKLHFHSCANNNPIEYYDIYTKNPDSCGVCVVIEDGKIKGRRSFQQGIQVENSGDFRKGEFYTVWGNYYGCGGGRGVYDTMITDYLRETYYAFEMSSKKGSLIIPFETRFSNYFPFDTMQVCFKENLLSDKGSYYDKWRNWEDAYGARCPSRYVRQRLEEEARGEYFKPPHGKPRKAPEFPPGFERDINFFKKGLSMA